VVPKQHAVLKRYAVLVSALQRRTVRRSRRASGENRVLLDFVNLAALRSNSALLTDTYTSPLRAQHGAAKRGR
jgi:hypothetical protein